MPSQKSNSWILLRGFDSAFVQLSAVLELLGLSNTLRGYLLRNRNMLSRKGALISLPKGQRPDEQWPMSGLEKNKGPEGPLSAAVKTASERQSRQFHRLLYLHRFQAIGIQPQRLQNRHRNL
jgi:hypothetical protein